MKKICFFSGDITRGGGTERVASTVANGLAMAGRYEVMFVSLVEAAERPFFHINEKIKRHVLGDKWISPGPGYLKVIPKLRKVLKEEDVDVIIDIDIVLDVLSVPATMGLKAETVSWEHFSPEYETSSLYRRLILKWSVRHTAHVVTLTEHSRRHYADRLGRKDGISVVPNPVQEADCKGMPEREKWIVTVGRLVHEKGIDYLCEAAKVVLKGHPGWKWVVVGDGEERVLLERLIETEGLQEQLFLAGRVEDVNHYLKRASIYAMTSRTECLPMCLLEAKACQLPSVCFDIPGIREIVTPGVDGHVVPAFDCGAMAAKLAELMENDALRQSFSGHAKDNMDRFREADVLAQWDGILCGLLQG